MSKQWSKQESLEQYLIEHWGAPYFSVNSKGNMICQAGDGQSNHSIDLKALMDDLTKRGIEPPILVRFNDILKSRVNIIADAFSNSIKEYGYNSDYHCFMPIKVNQQRHVLEELIKHGEDRGLGLECGSKPELLAALALVKQKNLQLICNGYKDVEYIEIALSAQKLGLNPYLVVDRFEELELILTIAKRLGVKPNLGFRAKLSAKGAGKWLDSSGDRSKFGLTSGEMVRAIDILQERSMLDSLKLLHSHIGSQITNIRSVKNALREAAHLYCNLRELGAANLQIIDVGGGLAVDYDGSKTNFHASMNYSTQEYANDVVSTLQDICDENGAKHPTIVSESGRALVAHHAALIFNVLGSNEMAKSGTSLSAPVEDDHTVLHTMWEAYDSLSKKNMQEAYNDAVTAKEESVTLFGHGVIDLKTKAKIDDLFWAICKKIKNSLSTLSYVPEDLRDLSKKLSDTYFCNFSVFQSMPDAWAVNHLFPISPIHRLNEQPTQNAILADLTCDSDGKIDQFIDLRDVKDTIKLHKLNDKPYYLGVFLVGAYQETLGDLHNLFGDTNAVHVSLQPDGSYELEHLVAGDTVEEVLSYVEYDKNNLTKSVRKLAEQAVKSGKITLEESAAFMRQYKDGLSGYTYLEEMS